MRSLWWLLVPAFGLVSCGGGDEPAVAEVLVQGEAVTIAALPDGGFLWADLDGTVHDAEGEIVAEVEVTTEGQRGLLGLTVAPDGRVFVGYTDPDERLVVGEIVAGAVGRTVWLGPETVGGGNGGRVEWVDGELVVGVGLLNDRDAQADPTSVVGKLVALDPDGVADQEPRILSGPWFNPFAFDATPGGEVWVADNEPRDGDERVARGDLGIDPEIALVLPNDSAPSGLAAVEDAAGGTALVICSYNTGQLDRYVLGDDGLVLDATLADDCRLDVERLADGSLVYSTGTSVVGI